MSSMFVCYLNLYGQISTFDSHSNQVFNYFGVLVFTFFTIVFQISKFNISRNLICEKTVMNVIKWSEIEYQ